MSCRRLFCTRAARDRLEAALTGLEAPHPPVTPLNALDGLAGPLTPSDLLVIDYDALPPAQRRGWAEQLAQPQGRPEVVWLSGGEYRHDLVWLLERGALQHVVAGATADDCQDLRGTLHRLLTQEYFGVHRYLGPVERRARVSSSDSWDKARVLREVEAFGRALQVHPRLTEHLKLVAEELFTNAIYNAPVDANGENRYRHFDRTQQVKLAQGEQVSVELLGSATRLAVVAEDPFGSLTEERLRAYLARCLRRDGEQIEPKQGGAGLGLFQVFESVTHLLVSIDPGQRTELIGVIDRGSSYRQFSSVPKSLNVFVTERNHLHPPPATHST